MWRFGGMPFKFLLCARTYGNTVRTINYYTANLNLPILLNTWFGARLSNLVTPIFLAI